MIKIKSDKMSYGINFPTYLDEISPMNLTVITNGVKLPKHYCIIALAFNTKIFDFCTAMNSNKNTNVEVTPILAKISEEDAKDVNASVGDKIIIDRTSLERGVHINLKTAISSTFARNYFNKDTDLIRAIVTKDNKALVDKKLNKQLVSAQSPNIIILEFKICPVTDISAAIPMQFEAIDPFLVDDNHVVN